MTSISVFCRLYPEFWGMWRKRYRLITEDSCMDKIDIS